MTREIDHIFIVIVITNLILILLGLAIIIINPPVNYCDDGSDLIDDDLCININGDISQANISNINIIYPLSFIIIGGLTIVLWIIKHGVYY